MRIGVNENNDAVTRSSEAALEGTRFPVILLLQQTNARLAARDALNFRSRSIARTVVHDHDFNFTFVICSQKRSQSFRDHFLFIVSSHDDADRRCEICFPSAAKASREPDNNQRSNNDKCGRNDHKGPEKLFDAVIDAKAGAAHESIN